MYSIGNYLSWAEIRRELKRHVLGPLVFDSEANILRPCSILPILLTGPIPGTGQLPGQGPGNTAGEWSETGAHSLCAAMYWNVLWCNFMHWDVFCSASLHTF